MPKEKATCRRCGTSRVIVRHHKSIGKHKSFWCLECKAERVPKEKEKKTRQKKMDKMRKDKIGCL